MANKFVRNEEGVSNIVTSIMMLGVLMSILGMVMAVYLPLMAKGTEINHMEEISNTFIDLKGTIDRQIISNDIGTTLTTRIRLGEEGGQLLGVGRTSGDLEFTPHLSPGILYNTDSPLDQDGRPLDIYGSNRGVIKYTSNNVYYIDQEYIYENGAVIIEQRGRAVMRVRPNFIATKNNITNTTSVTTTLISLDGSTTTRGGTESQTIETTLQIGTEPRLPFLWGNGSIRWSGENITYEITTKYPDLWEQFFGEVLNDTNSNLVWDKDMAGPLEGDFYIDRKTPTNPLFTDYTIVALTIRDVNSLDCIQSVIETKLN